MRCFTATYKYELCPTNFSLLVLTMSPDKSVQKEGPDLSVPVLLCAFRGTTEHAEQERKTKFTELGRKTTI